MIAIDIYFDSSSQSDLPGRKQRLLHQSLAWTSENRRGRGTRQGTPSAFGETILDSEQTISRTLLRSPVRRHLFLCIGRSRSGAARDSGTKRDKVKARYLIHSTLTPTISRYHRRMKFVIERIPTMPNQFQLTSQRSEGSARCLVNKSSLISRTVERSLSRLSSFQINSGFS